MLKKSLLGVTLLVLSFLIVGCQSTPEANTNANTATATTAGPDNSEITTTTDSSGTRTETRVFRDNPRVAKVVVTTRDGQRTTKVYSRTGEERELKDDVGDALQATGDKIADGAGWVADKSETAFDKTKEGVKAGATEVADKAEDVADKTTSTAKKVGEESKDAAKTVADKTKDGAKKTGRRIKKIVTP